MSTSIKVVTEEQNDLEQIIFLNANELSFSVDHNHILNLEYNGKKYQNVILNRIFPYQAKEQFISVCAEEKELGIIKDINDLSKEQHKIVFDQLNFRYYTPSILRVKSAKEKMSYVYFEVETTSGNKTICVGEVSTNMRYISDDKIMITDVDGNRYYIENDKELDKNSMKKIEMYVY